MMIENVEIPTISLSVSDSSASEAGLGQGNFVVTRAATDISNSLTVSYAITGKATNGTDYETLSGTVTISPYQSQASIPLIPKQDLVNELL